MKGKFSLVSHSHFSFSFCSFFFLFRGKGFMADLDPDGPHPVSPPNCLYITIASTKFVRLQGKTKKKKEAEHFLQLLLRLLLIFVLGKAHRHARSKRYGRFEPPQHIPNSEKIRKYHPNRHLISSSDRVPL